ncbi:sigma 54-interacting transcriptional regulator [Vibrio sp.]|uniref:sigma-54-dependent Fis family transcriptional regulator n=1 Tax=Vibrio sp. TaxID=678 RepID=UPI00311E8A8B
MEQKLLQMDSWLASPQAKDQYLLNSSLGLHYGDPDVELAWLHALKVVCSGIHLLVLGETGVGKGEFVKALHQHSHRCHKPLVTVNCAALPNDLIEAELFGYAPGSFTGANPKGFCGRIRQADKGILFLDEIGDMSLQAQCRLLSVLQDKLVTPLGSTRSYSIDVEVISATHQDLEHLIAKGSFRQDLYYRLNGLTVVLPALRKRKDKAALIRSIHENYRDHSQTISLDLIKCLMSYSWPGNIRELDNLIKVVTVMAEGTDVVDFQHLPLQWRRRFSQANDRQLLDTDLKSTLNKAIEDVYIANRGNISKVARELGVSRNTVYRRLKAQKVL